ncbi:MAG: hypothetical protein ABIN74_11810 [Ferruginibacter sp.]
MQQKITILIYRQYLQTISDHLFPSVIAFKNSAVLQGKSFGETSYEFLMSLIINTHINQMDIYFKRRLQDTTKPTIELKLTEAEVVVLYQAFMNLPLLSDKTYLLIVRQDFVSKLHHKLYSIASAALAGQQKIYV